MWKQYLELPRPIHILCLGSFINRAGSFFVIFLTIYISDRLGFGISFAAWCMGVFGAGAIVSSLLGGHLADRYGRRVVMIVSLFGGAKSGGTNWLTIIWQYGNLKIHGGWTFGITISGIAKEARIILRPVQKHMRQCFDRNSPEESS